MTALEALSDIDRRTQEIAALIDAGKSTADLKPVAVRIDEWLASVHDKGIGPGLITALVSELNDRLLRRLWTLLAPPELLHNSCLVVMGSEGRAEQTLKTDQDNALLLSDEHDIGDLQALAESFTSALIDFGYPPCPGGIMLNNPAWRWRQAELREAIRSWCVDADSSGPMHLAILLDARAIAGAPAMLDAAKSYLWSIVPDTDVFLARFTTPVEQFDQTSGGWWHWLAERHGGHERVVDLKKSGSFQIVHGVRSLALKHHVAAVSTQGRLHTLVEQHDFPATLARDLLGALQFLTSLKLSVHLRQRSLGRPAVNTVQFTDLGTIEHAELNCVMAIIKVFRQYLRMHCHLDRL